MALNTMLARLHEIVALDVSNEKIEDLSAPPRQRTIVGPKRLAASIG